jgi:hypothetical protein
VTCGNRTVDCTNLLHSAQELRGCQVGHSGVDELRDLHRSSTRAPTTLVRRLSVSHGGSREGAWITASAAIRYGPYIRNTP